MPKPYSLTLYNPVWNTPNDFVTPLTKAAIGWKRSWRLQGGCWQGSFSYAGGPGGFLVPFQTWLGYHVLEKVGGAPSWSGMIYEMDFTKNGITRRRSLDLMANRIKTTYTTLDWSTVNFIENAGFELFNAAAPNDDFYSWYEANGANGSVQSSATAHGGAASVRLDSDSDDPTQIHVNTYIRQNLQVTPGAKYKFSFWTLGDGGAQHQGGGGSGMYGVRNPNAPTSWVVGPTETRWFSNTVWKEISVYFTGPSEGEVMIFFIAPFYYDVVAGTSRYAFFDDAALYEEAQCVYETQWADLDEYGTTGGPIARYGCKEEVIHLDAYPENTSIAYRDTYLAEHAWPWPRPVTVTDPGEARLDVFVAGYVHTANWQYVTEGDGTAHDLDDWLRLIVGSTFGRSPNHGGYDADAGDCMFIKTGNIQANTLQVPQLTGVEERPWDVISELVALGDANGAMWHARVSPARDLHYLPVDTVPRYFLRKDGIYDTMAGNSPSNPWTMRPGVVRDMTYRGNMQEPGSFLTSAQDMLVEEVEMADGWARPSLKTVVFSEAELLAARMERGL